jgi:hypothetical protein
MKLLKKLVLLTLVIGLAGACTKLEESPAPGGTTNNGGGGGGPTGNPAVYIGLWKLTEKTKAGNSIFNASNTFTVKLDVAATAEWTYTVFGVPQAPIADSYILKTTPPPATIDFENHGVKEIVSKTGSQIVWQYNDINEGGELVVETLTKQ